MEHCAQLTLVRQPSTCTATGMGEPVNVALGAGPNEAWNVASSSGPVSSSQKIELVGKPSAIAPA